MIKNASQYPRRFFGLHFTEGTAEYRLPDKEPFKIFVGEKCMRGMDKSFEGKPVFVGHKDDVTPLTVESADGFVVKSFYNQADGKHWAEFMVTTDRGLDAINKGFKLSNAYKIIRSGMGGRWHGMDYEQEVLDGEYDHLAIVDDPRYSESIILTPDEFKDYNEKKLNEIKNLQNSDNPKGVKSMFKFFKKQKVENSEINLDDMSVVLPKSKKEIDLATLINKADEEAVNEDKPKYAVKHALVKTNEGDMTVEELVNKYHKNCGKKKNEDEEEKENEDDDKKKENQEEDEVLKKEEPVVPNKEDEVLKKEEPVVPNSENLDKLKNAENNVANSFAATIDLGEDKVARGKKRYGSK